VGLKTSVRPYDLVAQSETVGTSTWRRPEVRKPEAGWRSRDFV